MSKIQEVSTAVENGKTKLIEDLVQGALDEGSQRQTTSYKQW